MYGQMPVHLWLEVLLEDVCRMGPTNDAWHIKVSWASVVKGVNLQLLLQAKRLQLHTDSLFVNHWISGTLTGKAILRTKAASKMLMRWKLEILKSLVAEYNLTA